jgi:hypothetical protein
MNVTWLCLRYEALSSLDKPEKEKLFDDHIDRLIKKKKASILSLLSFSLQTGFPPVLWIGLVLMPIRIRIRLSIMMPIQIRALP